MERCTSFNEGKSLGPNFFRGGGTKVCVGCSIEASTPCMKAFWSALIVPDLGTPAYCNAAFLVRCDMRQRHSLPLEQAVNVYDG